MSLQYLITGTDTVNARKKFIEIKKSFGEVNFVEIDLSTASPLELAERLNLTDMFSQTVFIFVNFSLTSKAVWDSLLKNLGSQPAIFEAIGKSTGRLPASLKKQLQVIALDTRTQIFNLLNSLATKNQKQFLSLLDINLADTAEPVVMTMVQNRIRDLIIVSTAPESFKGQSWQKQQLISQAKNFTLPQLLQLYRRLLSIEIREKSSLNPDSYSQHFAIELLSL